MFPAEVRFVEFAETEVLEIHPSIRLRIQHYAENRPEPISADRTGSAGGGEERLHLIDDGREPGRLAAHGAHRGIVLAQASPELDEPSRDADLLAVRARGQVALLQRGGDERILGTKPRQLVHEAAVFGLRADAEWWATSPASRSCPASRTKRAPSGGWNPTSAKSDA